MTGRVVLATIMFMIDGFRAPKRPNNIHPSVKAMTDNIVVADHSKKTFKPPQEVAATEQKVADTTAGNLVNGTPPPTPVFSAPATPPKKRSFKEWLRALSGKQKALLIAGLVVLLAGAGVGAYFLFFAESAPVPAIVKKEEKKEEPKPTTVASNLTGLQVDPSVNERPVIASMIENSMDARPQSGLSEAGVVFEAIAEGGITRFVALFQDTQPDYIGPVRSARPYYMQWMLGFDAGYAHAGGSAEALSLINQWGVKDLPHHNSYFWRVSSRAAPHNLYSSVPKLNEYAASKGFGKSNFTPIPRNEKEGTPAATPTARTIDLNISSATFNVHYDYDATTNSYKRSEGGAPHTDEKSGAQISPKVVVALIMPQGKNGIYYTYQTIGSGQVLIFQDGIVTSGTWKKDSNSANFTFTDAAGAELKLNPGQTWFTALGEASRVTYAP
jgi:hypothetical protein